MKTVALTVNFFECLKLRCLPWTGALEATHQACPNSPKCVRLQAEATMGSLCYASAKGMTIKVSVADVGGAVCKNLRSEAPSSLCSWDTEPFSDEREFVSGRSTEPSMRSRQAHGNSSSLSSMSPINSSTVAASVLQLKPETGKWTRPEENALQRKFAAPSQTQCKPAAFGPNRISVSIAQESDSDPVLMGNLISGARKGARDHRWVLVALA